MSGKNISTKQLSAFLALDELKHFTRAAERCHLSQSAFSTVISKLEESVGAKLFERDTRNVKLTPEGMLFAEVARSLYEEISSAFDNMADYVARRRGRVAIAALPSLAAHGLPAIIAEYRQRYPSVATTLYDSLSDQCLAMLRDGRVDFALTALGPHLAEFDTHILCSDPFYLVCRRDHRLAGLSKIVPGDLDGCEMVHLVKSTSVRQHVDALLRDVATVPSGLEAEHLATVAGLVQHGLGVTLVPEMTLFQFRLLDLLAIPVEAPDSERAIYIVKRKDRSLSIAAQGMLELIESTLRVTAARMEGVPGLQAV
jgi:DNA-binding transcriptional LysR family regulator